MVPCHGLVPPKLPVSVLEEEISELKLEAGSRRSVLWNTDSPQVNSEMVQYLEPFI